ncbi:hypothetical protein [Oceanicoccus sp. KOV_DT_Chl]|uniref:hypothetical protein n=1 Tax=Oceanicoccus sp. KOV_DT_Chl TaxID=1904639 RepID=UPI000C7CD43A|nr:hypothetical protein [Oceanicoccus sp. KOV_DT_Chl]
MQISSLPIVTLPPSQTQRSDISTRVVKDVQRETTRNADDDRNNSSLDELRARSDELLQQRVDSASAGSGLNNSNSNQANRQPLSRDDLPLNTRKALQTFAENTPTPEQRLGVELVGIDTFA